MNEQEQKQLSELLKRAVAPMDRELHHDLWPKMRCRLNEPRDSHSWLAALFSATKLSLVPWFDWALLAALVLGVCAFPSSIPIWLYNF
jgi:hypothetical protein